MLCSYCNQILSSKYCSKTCREEKLFKTIVLNHDPILVSFSNNSYVRYINREIKENKKPISDYSNFQKYLLRYIH